MISSTQAVTMFDTFLGLPLHPLVVHAAVIVVPAAALAVALAALWPRFRALSGAFPLALSLAALILTPVSVQSGRELERRVGEGVLVARHAALAEDLLPWVVALAFSAAVLFWIRRWERRSPDSDDRTTRRVRAGGGRRFRVAVVAVALVALASAVGSAVQVARIGHSGSEAAWSEVVESQNP